MGKPLFEIVLALSQVVTSGNGTPGPGAGEQASTEQRKPEEYCSVEGVVIDAKSEAPVGKARLELFGADGRRVDGRRRESNYVVTTTASGRFLFERVEPGRYRLGVRRNGYSRPSAAWQPEFYSLSTGERLKGIVIKLLRAAVITGRVVDEDGEPVPYANVTVVRSIRQRSKRELSPVGRAVTNDLGEYRAFGIAPGKYYVAASVDDNRNREFRGRGRAPETETVYATQYYPGVPDPSETTAITLGAGEERSGIDFRLSRVRTVRVSGRVVSQITGKPLPDVTVYVMAKRGGRSILARASTDRADSTTGEFSIGGVLPGARILNAHSGEGSGEMLFARMEIEVGDNNLEGLQLALSPGATVTGRVTVEGQRSQEKEIGNATVFLNRQQDEGEEWRSGAVRVKADASFEIKQTRPGRFTIRMENLPQNWYLKAVRVGNQDVLESGFPVEAGSEVGPVHVVLSPLGGRVEGSVIDPEKKPFPGAKVVLVPDKRSRDDLFNSADTDQNGRFQLQGIPPGEYKLFAWDKIDSGMYFDPSFLELYETDGVKVPVKEGSIQTNELKLLLAEDPVSE